MRSSKGARAARAVRAATLLTAAAAVAVATGLLTAGAAASPGAALRPASPATAGPAAWRWHLTRLARPSAGGWRLSAARHYGRASNASGFSAVVAPARSDVWAFGGTNPGGTSRPVALRLENGHWRPVRLPAHLSGFISAASAPSRGDIWAVGYNGGYVLHFNGHRWSVAGRWRSHGVLTSVAALSPSNVWVFGTSVAGATGLGTWHFNGRSWHRVGGLAGDIYRASVVSARDIWAVAATRHGSFIEHYDGRSWHRVRPGSVLAGASLDDVLGLSARKCWVAGNARRGAGRLVLAQLNGRHWSGLRTRWQAGTGRLAPDGAGGVWVTADDGSDSVVGHWPQHGRLSWTGLQHGSGSGITDIVVNRRTGGAWLSGGFLSRNGGDAAVWFRPGGFGSGLNLPAVARPRPAAPLDVRSWRLDLASLLRSDRPTNAVLSAGLIRRSLIRR
jgi:hypothetical protein